jgi:glycosyltransferase involved in cell wall biosynthesis
LITNKLVSIIIPTYNSSPWIRSCLASIQKQTYPSIEVIIVDNFSEDDTVDIAQEFNTRIIKKRSERSIARNEGINQSNGTYILSLDSDMELETDVVSECVHIFENHIKAGGVVIPEISFGKSYWVKVRNYERSFYEHTKIESARFFKKALIEKVSGYEEDIVFFEESTLPQKIEKLGYDISLRIHSHIIHHEEYFDILQWLKKKFYYAQHIGIYKKKYSSYANDQMNPFYRFDTFLKNKDKRFFSKPFLAFGVIVLKTLEYLFSGLGILFS